MRTNSSGETLLDRFMPSVNVEYAQYALFGTDQTSSPSREAYRRHLAEEMGINRSRIFDYRTSPQAPVQMLPWDYSASLCQLRKSVKPPRYIPKTAERTLHAPDFVDDLSLNLLHWGSANVLAIALGDSVYLWDVSSGPASQLLTVDAEIGPVTSVNWAPDGHHLAVGLSNSQVLIWDSASSRQLTTLESGHRSGVGALAWRNNNILTTGGLDGQITDIDVRIESHVVTTYRGHSQEVCGLKWSGSGQQLASGGNDNAVHTWDIRSSTRRLHSLRKHTSAVKALAWCPFEEKLLATGGSGGDGTIKFWNTHTGACLSSVDTGSEVCSLLWSTKERELLSSHGSPHNQLTLRKYPSMVKMAELTGHTSRVLGLAQSPDGCTVASAAPDEQLMLWNVFGEPGTSKKRAPTNSPLVPFSHLMQIR